MTRFYFDINSNLFNGGRIVLMMGAVFAATTLYARTKVAETPRYTAQVAKQREKANADMERMNRGDNFEEETIKIKDDVNDLTFGQFCKGWWKQVLGCAMCWFLLDVAFYSQNLFQSQVFLQAGFLLPAKNMYALQETAAISKAQAIIALGSTIPGYWFTVFLVDTLGRKFIQLMGFIMTTGLMAALAGSYMILLDPNTTSGAYLNPNQPFWTNGWITMYALCFFFMNFGPNSTTFIYPAELFPTKFKARAHGFCAGMGKAGAIIGAFGFLYASQPASGELTWAYPCQGATTIPNPMLGISGNSDLTWTIRANDLVTSSQNPDAVGACQVKNNCPTGWYDVGYYKTVPFGKSGSQCTFCQTNLLSLCYPFGLGQPVALGILAATNFAGMLFTFLLPETNQKTLEELNGTKVDEKEIEGSNPMQDNTV